MYCAKCGVKLADTEKTCPLCGTVAYHPDIPRQAAAPLYPADQYPLPPKLSKMAHIIVTTAFLLPLLLVLMGDLRTNGTVTWSGYVIGALLLGYVCVVLPAWFKKPNPVIFVPCGFACGIVFLLYICLHTGGSWFLSFAFPIAGGLGLVTTAAVTLMRYIRRGKLYILGGMVIALAGLFVLSEFLMMLTFHVKFLGWSLYPAVTLFLLGGMLLFLAICRSARKAMARRLFI